MKEKSQEKTTFNFNDDKRSAFEILNEAKVKNKT